MVWGAIAGAAIGAVAGGVESNQARQAAKGQNQWINAAGSRAQAVADQPFQAYGGEMVAGATGNENLAFNQASHVGSDVQGYLDSANQGFTSDNLQKYMNPYAKGVTDIAERDLTQAYGEQLAGELRKGSMSDAFGYGRSAANMGELNKNYMRQFGDTATKGASGAFEFATGQFNKDRQNNISLANEKLNADRTSISALQDTGQNMRSISQAKDSADYGQFMRQQNWAKDQLQPLLSAAGNRPVAMPSTASGILGGAIGGASIGMGLGGMMGGNGLSGADNASILTTGNGGNGSMDPVNSMTGSLTSGAVSDFSIPGGG